MSKGVLDSVLTPEEREWSFALEEALYGTANTSARNSRNGRRGARLAFRRNRINNNGNTNGNHNTNNNKNNKNKNNNTNETWNNNEHNKYADMPTDFELASHAMIGKGNTARALKRIRRLSEFKETYRVPDFECDTLQDQETMIEQVLLVLKKFVLAYPGFIKSIGMDKHGRVALVLRLRGLRWSSAPPFNHTEADRFKALYCLMNAVQPTPESVRRGTVWIADLGGVANKPASPFLEGCRKLLRDSYPIKIQDIPVVRCPPIWSGAFVGTYPFWSRHFAAKFVRVESETLRRHFPSELLNTNSKKKKNNNANNNTKTTTPGTIGGTMPLHRKKAIRDRNSNNGRGRRRRGNNNNNNNSSAAKKKAVRVVASNTGDRYDNNWENLDDVVCDDEDDRDGYILGNDNDDGYDDSNSHSHSEWSDWTSVGGAGSLSGAEAAIGKTTSNDELWVKIEKLVRMRFETERTFRVA